MQDENDDEVFYEDETARDAGLVRERGSAVGALVLVFLVGILAISGWFEFRKRWCPYSMSIVECARNDWKPLPKAPASQGLDYLPLGEFSSCHFIVENGQAYTYCATKKRVRQPGESP